MSNQEYSSRTRPNPTQVDSGGIDKFPVVSGVQSSGTRSRQNDVLSWMWPQPAHQVRSSNEELWKATVDDPRTQCKVGEAGGT